MKAVRFIPAAALAACIVLTACSDYVGKEATHPLYAKYETSKSAKSYREAAESLEEFLSICPKSPKAHYDVAKLYKENLENYPAAIYHLLKYLELSGETLSKQDQEAIRGYIRDCERLMFDSYRNRNDIKLADEVQPSADPAKLAAKNAENAALREKIQKYIENEKVILAQNQELRNRLAGARPAERPKDAPVSSSSATSSASTATATRGVPSSTTGTPGTTVAGENGVRYYYVAKGDGLQAIAQKMYGKASMWKIIQDANKEALGERGILKIGQKLVIPPAPAKQ